MEFQEFKIIQNLFCYYFSQLDKIYNHIKLKEFCIL